MVLGPAIGSGYCDEDEIKMKLHWSDAKDWVDRVVRGDIFKKAPEAANIDVIIEMCDSVPVSGWRTALEDHADSEDPYLYIDLRSDSVSPANRLLFQLEFDEDLRKLSAFFLDRGNPIENGIEKCGYQVGRHILDWLIDDSFLIAKWLLAFGDKEGFLRTLRLTYMNGLMPIGWQGSYPEGRLLALDPDNLANDPQRGV